jgi:hypothetical protein
LSRPLSNPVAADTAASTGSRSRLGPRLPPLQDAIVDLAFGNRNSTIGTKIVPVAQLDRASDFGSEGWGFESLQARIQRCPAHEKF